jgi:hypothetical protein
MRRNALLPQIRTTTLIEEYLRKPGICNQESCNKNYGSCVELRIIESIYAIWLWGL